MADPEDDRTGAAGTGRGTEVREGMEELRKMLERQMELTSNATHNLMTFDELAKAASAMAKLTTCLIALEDRKAVAERRKEHEAWRLESREAAFQRLGEENFPEMERIYMEAKAKRVE